MSKRIISFLIVFYFILLTPHVKTCVSLTDSLRNSFISAESTYNDIVFGTERIVENKIIYFGSYYDSTDYPVPWIVLNQNVLYQSLVESGEDSIPLLSEYLLGNSIFRYENDNGYYHYSTVTGTSDSSVLKQKMESLYNGQSLFTQREQSQIMSILLSSKAVGGKISGTVGENALHSNSTSSEITEFKLTVLDNAQGSGRDLMTLLPFGKTSRVKRQTNIMQRLLMLANKSV